MPNVNIIKQLISNEHHKTHFLAHPGYQKLITTLRKGFYWSGVKSKVVEQLTK